MENSEIAELRKRLLAGMVIPAHPLALDAQRKLDERRQRALSRYYLAAGAGGLAIGVHTTQFEIHDPRVGLYQPVLQLGREVAINLRPQASGLGPILVAGLVGPTSQAIREAGLARELGYHCGLLSLGAMRDASEDQLIEHARAVAEVIPLFGFYLQPAAGGRLLGFSFWRRLVEIEGVVAIKIAPFNRYQTLDVTRALAQSGRAGEIALYTGNDDSIVLDLLTEFPGGVRIAGGLLGHWAVWTHKAVELLQEIHRVNKQGAIPQSMLKLNAEVTDSNAALFDPQHQFAGCIPGIHEVLRRQGLLAGRWCLNPAEELSPGQMEEIDRIYASYPHLTDEVTRT
ncbi:MAG: dihydrodipicolinate synthase family protein [Acidobacteriota bacterium]